MAAATATGWRRNGAQAPAVKGARNEAAEGKVFSLKSLQSRKERCRSTETRKVGPRATKTAWTQAAASLVVLGC
jgi:hypothetical protein